MAELRLTGSPIKKEVKDSIDLRQKIMNEQPVGAATVYDPTAKIKYVSQRMPWVRLSSSVNLSGTKAAYFTQLTGGEAAGDNLARRFVLKNYAEDSYYRQQGLEGYSNSLNLGVRPEPGITSVNVKHFNRFGSLRATTINFVCWSLEQLEILDVLYMRPGYTALLEFGHSVYVDKDGAIKTTAGNLDFFNAPKSTKAIYKAIEEQRVANNYHYDAVFGFIKNFKWTFRDDGGYDCVTEIVSIGEVVESVKASFSSPGTSFNDEGAETKGTSFAGKNRDKNSDKSALEEIVTVMHQILTTVRNDLQELYSPARTGFILTSISSTVQAKLTAAFPELAKVTDSGFTGAMYSPGVLTVDSGVSNTLAPDQQPTYVKLAFLLDVLNIGVPTDNQSKEKLYEFWTPTTAPSGPFHSYKYSQYRPSIDPGVCLVHAHESIFDFVNISEGDHKAGTYTAQNQINEIFVNIDFILAQYRPDIDTLEFLKSILAGIQEALGNVNQFELQYFEESGLYAVVDRNRITESTSEQRPKLEIFGNKTFAKAVTLSSLLSPKISTMIAIGAQAGGSSGGIEGTAFAKLNAGLTDRIKPVKLAGVSTSSTTESEDSTSTSQLKPLDVIEGHLFNLYSQYEYIPQNCQEVRQIYADYLADKVAQTKNPSFTFVIPFELTLTVDGISGMKISEAFDIPDEVLPAPYKNQAGRSVVSFLITGLDQNITSTGWTTGIRSQMYISETSQGKYGYNIDNITFTPRETLYSATGPSTDGASQLYYKGTLSNADTVVQNEIHTDPVAKSIFRQFLQGLLANNQGIRVDITSAIRTEEKQRELYNAYTARGKEGLPAAPPGASSHEIGLALDFVISDLATRQELAGSESTKQVWEQYKVASIATQAGLRWGGDWKENYDPIHVYLTTEKAFGVSKDEYLKKYEEARAQNPTLQKWAFDPRKTPTAPTITNQSAPVSGPRLTAPATGLTPPPLRLDPSAAAAIGNR